MKFLNRRTGAVIDVPCPVEGPDWERITEANKAESRKAPTRPAEKAVRGKRTAKKGAE